MGVSLLFLCIICPVNAGEYSETQEVTGIWITKEPGENDISMHFGTVGDNPVTGDWNNDGISIWGYIGHPTGTGISTTAKTGAYSRPSIWATGDIPVVGDWNNDGISDVGVFRPSNGNWYLDTTKTGVVIQTFHFEDRGYSGSR